MACLPHPLRPLPILLCLLALSATLSPQQVNPRKLKPEDDVYLIGDRKVGSGIDFYSQKKEIALGQELARQVEENSVVIKDPEVNEYVNRLAQNLVRNSDAKVPFTVRVLRDDSINAFALPGGYFFVNSGLILGLNEEDELAGAMAHEIAHVAARHATRNMTKGELLSLAAIPVEIAAGPGLGGLGVAEAADLIVPMKYMSFTRGAEREADWLGVQYLWKAGYDPMGMVRAFQVLEELDKKRPGLFDRAFASHPQTPDRVAASEREIATILPPRPEYVVNTSDFNRVKLRLAKLIEGAKVKAPGANRPPAPPGPPVITRTPNP
ncbi:MAG: M48 family metallopeptidase [Terriglobales bacterium]